jgi:hypothetical protein
MAEQWIKEGKQAIWASSESRTVGGDPDDFFHIDADRGLRGQ